MTKKDTWFTALPVCVGTVGVHRETGKVHPLRCKRWQCPTCAKLNALTLSIRVVEGINHYQSTDVPLSFVTTTAWGRYTTSPDLAYSELPVWWGKLHDRLRYRTRRIGAKLEYAAFIEEQSRGVPHLHAIITYPLTTTALKKMAIKSGFGFSAKSEPVKTHSVGWYIAKYLTKSGGGMANAPDGHKRVRFSANWPALPDRPLDDKLIVKGYDESYAAWAHRAAGIAHRGAGELIKDVQKLLRAQLWELAISEIDQLPEWAYIESEQL